MARLNIFRQIQDVFSWDINNTWINLLGIHNNPGSACIIYVYDLMVKFSKGSGDPYNGDENFRVAVAKVDEMTGGTAAPDRNSYFGDNEDSSIPEGYFVGWLGLNDENPALHSNFNISGWNNFETHMAFVGLSDTGNNEVMCLDKRKDMIHILPGGVLVVSIRTSTSNYRPATAFLWIRHTLQAV